MSARNWLLGVGAALGLAQLVPIERSNPPVEQEIAVPDPVRAILRRACYDCHSHETRWPWYSYVAPVSWLVRHDVNHARRHMNFSTWNRYDDEEQQDHIEEISEEVEDGEMPLWYYAAMHSESRLSDADRDALREWSEASEQAAPTSESESEQAAPAAAH